MNQPMSLPSVLLVEDAQDLAQVIIRELQAAGYNVLHTNMAEKGLQIAKTTSLQMVILDWMLPGMDGLTMLRQLRETSTIPVLMLTARDSELDRVLGLEVGADDYLVKPFSIRELIARVRAMLRRREIIEQTVTADQTTSGLTLVVGSLILEPDAYMVTMNNEVVDFTRTEFELLYLLASNPGRVFSRAYLLETVWGENYVDGDRSVDNMVLRLRKKLPLIETCIETVWGVGYRWKRACHD
jgi:DNA-binding response OmpR family regulator